MKEIYIPAEVDFDQSLRSGIPIRNGQDLLLTAKLIGKPTPKVSWMPLNHDIKENDFIKIKNTHSTSELLIKDTKLKHSGEYTISVSNHYGTKQMSCSVTILDRPGKVDALEVYDVTNERVRIQWNPEKRNFKTHLDYS